MATDTNQTELKRDKKGRIVGGKPPAGFNKHPENRSDGRWNKEDSISYQYNRLMRMSIKELEDFKAETVAQDIALNRIKAARNEKFGLPDAKEITDRTEGKAAQAIDLTSSDGSMTPTVIVEGVYGNKPNFRPSNEAPKADDLAKDSSPESS